MHEGLTILENTGHIVDPQEIMDRERRWVADLNRASHVKRFVEGTMETDDG